MTHLTELPPRHLSAADFKAVVRDTPLVSIDLLVMDQRQRILVGLRTNDPVRGFWFAPGGRIRKGENFNQAFRRLTEAELGQSLDISEATFVGTYEHFYAEDFTGASDAGTHYVVLAYSISVDPTRMALPEEQHTEYRWVTADEALSDASIHPNTQAYARK
ncbi:TPA: GDP-mannose mannosyl hydrolase [Stenotrophomonas maltophilia]